MYRIGIDIGATNMRVGLFDGAYHLVAREQMKTEAALGPVQALSKLVTMIDAVDPHHQAASIGIGAPGPLDVDRGMILDAPNLPGWYEFALVDMLSEQYGKPVALINDAKAAALAEARIGAGQDAGSVQYVTVSTGVGGGLVINGQVFAGAHQHAAEVGNMVVDASLEHGTLEDLCSGTALLKASQYLFGIDAKAADLFTYYHASHHEARRAVDNWLHYFAAAVTSMIQVVDPEVFVLGGAVILHNPWLVELLTPIVEQLVYTSMAGSVQLRVATLGDDAGLYGAAMLIK